VSTAAGGAVDLHELRFQQPPRSGVDVRAAHGAQPARRRTQDRRPPDGLLHVDDGDATTGTRSAHHPPPGSRPVRDHGQGVGADGGVHGVPGIRVHGARVGADEGHVPPAVSASAPGGLAQHGGTRVHGDDVPGGTDASQHLAKAQAGAAAQIEHPVAGGQPERFDTGASTGTVDGPFEREEVVERREGRVRRGTPEDGGRRHVAMLREHALTVTGFPRHVLFAGWALRGAG
jgi:hypothetical protein